MNYQVLPSVILYADYCCSLPWCEGSRRNLEKGYSSSFNYLKADGKCLIPCVAIIGWRLDLQDIHVAVPLQPDSVALFYHTAYMKRRF